MKTINLEEESASTRDKLILTGLYLSKYDTNGLKALGCKGFTEAFNVIGYGLGSRAASIKNYRDEFDPHFPNHRKGWRKRATRDYCLAIMRRYESLDFNMFTGLVRSFLSYDLELSKSPPAVELDDGATSSFAQRLITGLAAEHYFESVHLEIREFEGRNIVNTTRHGCGYDYRLGVDGDVDDFLAIEVKGLRDRNGSISMTPKEYSLAAMLGDCFFLFIVKNFKKTPFHEMYRNPLSSDLRFSKLENVVVQTSWSTSV